MRNTKTRLSVEQLESRTLLALTLPLVDTFDRPDNSSAPGAWSGEQGEFRVHNNEYVATALGTSLASCVDATARNVRVEAVVRVPDTGVVEAGLVARHDSAGGRMILGTLVGRHGRFSAEIWKLEGGTWSRLTNAAVASGTGRLRFDVIESTLHLFLDDQLVASLSDPQQIQPYDGRVGIRASGRVAFDDFRADYSRGITHVLEDSSRVRLVWDQEAPRERDEAYVIVTANDTQAVQFQAWVYASELDLRLTPGSYTARIADSGEPYSVHRLTVPSTSITHRIDEPSGLVTLSWARSGEEGEATAYHLIVTNTDTNAVIFQDDVRDIKQELRLEPGTYRVQLTPPSGASIEYTFDYAKSKIKTTVEDTNLLKASWEPPHDAVAYHVVVTRQEDDTAVFSRYLYGRNLSLRLAPGVYTLQVAVPSGPYSTRFVNVATDPRFTYLEPGKGIARWDPLPGATAYLVTILDSSDGTVFRDYVYGTQVNIERTPDDYTVFVAAPGEESFSIEANLADFSAKTFTPLAPIGAVDRRVLSFSWFPVRGAVAYFFQLQDAAGRLIDSHWAYGTEANLMLEPGQYLWRVIPVNDRNEQASRTGWITITVTEQPLARENILGIEPDVPVPPHLAKLNYPEAAVEAADGTIYILDSQSSVIRRVKDGQVEVFAGTLAPGYNGDGYRTNVMFNRPVDLALDAAGNLLVLDAFNYLIRKLDLTSGQVSTIAGLPGVSQLPSDGDAAQGSPIGYGPAFDLDSAGNLYIPMLIYDAYLALVEKKLFRITTTGSFEEQPVTISGGIRDLDVADDHLDFIHDNHFTRILNSGAQQTVELASAFGRGILYLPDTQTTLVGNHSQIDAFDTTLERTFFAGGFANVASIMRVQAGVLVVDGDRGAILQYDMDGILLPEKTIGGTRREGTSIPVAVAKYDDDTMLVLENQKGYVYAYSVSTGRTTIFAGNGSLGPATLGVPAGKTGFWYPASLAIDSSKNVYVAENHRIILISPGGMTSLYAGDLAYGDNDDDVPRQSARFQSIRGLAFDSADNLYVADTYNNKIKRISPAGMVHVVAGTGEAGASEYGQPAIATALNHPHGVLPIDTGALLVADSWSNTVARIEPDGTLSRVAGIPKVTNYQSNGTFAGDGGPALEAGINTPTSLAMSDDGTLYIMDDFNNRVRAVHADGTISTFFGAGLQGYSADGSLFNLPFGLLIVGGDLYVTDTGNGLVSRLRLA